MILIRRRVLVALLGSAVVSTPVAAQEDHLQLEEGFQIGVADGPEQQMFGIIVDAVTDSHGNVYVLDRHSMHLSVYTRAGEFLAEAGRSGEGPGEYGYASALERDAEDLVHALDRRNARIYAYRLRDDELVLVSTTRVPPWIRDFCVLEGAYFALGYQSQGIIHELDEGGAIKRSFGAPFIDDPPGLHMVDIGELVCIPEPATLLVAATQLPLVRRYTPAGQLLWSTILDRFNRMRIEPFPGGVRLLNPEDGGFSDVTVTASHLGSGVALVQFGAARPEVGDPEAIDQTTSVFLSLDSGQEIHRVEGLGRIEFADGERLIEVAADPFPRLRVRRYEVVRQR